MSGQPPPPPPPFFPEAFAYNRTTNTRQNVTGDPAYLQGGLAPGHGHPPQMPSPTSYPSQQYSSSHPSPSHSRRSTLPTTPTYDHASLPLHPPPPPPLSGSTSYNPSFPVPAAPVRHSFTNPSGPPPPGSSPRMHRAATMPLPVYPNAASSVPYDMQPPNTMPSPSQPRILEGPQPTAQDWSYLNVHERDDDSSDEDIGQGRGGTRRSGGRHGGGTRPQQPYEDVEQSREDPRDRGEYRRDRSPPNRNSAGRQQGPGGRQWPPQQQPELLRCILCGRVSTRNEAERRHWYCTGGHMGQWQRT